VKTVSEFHSLNASTALVSVWYRGRRLDLPEGANLAAALLAVGITSFRETPVSGAPRGPYCMMGACFDCLVTIEGVTRQACMLEVSAGLRISSLADPQGGQDAL
jgi:predicted molibdopterin-dependent oxidoreductase YjgC